MLQQAEAHVRVDELALLMRRDALTPSHLSS